MLGLMQGRPLLISMLIEHAAKFHPEAEIVSRTSEGPIHRSNYADISRRSKQLANALSAMNVKPGDRIGCSVRAAFGGGPRFERGVVNVISRHNKSLEISIPGLSKGIQQPVKFRQETG